MVGIRWWASLGVPIFFAFTIRSLFLQHSGGLLRIYYLQLSLGVKSTNSGEEASIDFKNTNKK